VTKFQTVIFDFDGTIADSLPALWQTYETLRPQFRLPEIKSDEIVHLRKLGATAFFKQHLKLSRWQMARFIRAAWKEYANHIELIEPIKGMAEALGQLKNAGMKLGIVSSSSEETIHGLLQRFDLQMFDFIYGDGSIFGKAQLLSQVMRKESLSTESSVYVGDEIRDIEAAHKNNLKVIAVGWGLNDLESLKENGAEYACEKPSDLVQILK
jgi:phosphoglycolate phosphatase